MTFSTLCNHNGLNLGCKFEVWSLSRVVKSILVLRLVGVCSRERAGGAAAAAGVSDQVATGSVRGLPPVAVVLDQEPVARPTVRPAAAGGRKHGLPQASATDTVSSTS